MSVNRKKANQTHTSKELAHHNGVAGLERVPLSRADRLGERFEEEAKERRTQSLGKRVPVVSFCVIRA